MQFKDLPASLEGNDTGHATDVTRAVVGEVVVFGNLLDGGPVLCGACFTAWRPTDRCPNCGQKVSYETAPTDSTVADC